MSDQSSDSPEKKKNGHGGKRQGAGRKKDSRGRNKLGLRLSIQDTGLSPLDILLIAARTMYAAAVKDPENVRDDWLDRAIQYAKDAAPYCHPRMTTLEVGGKAGAPIGLAVGGAVVRVYLPDNGRRVEPAANDTTSALALVEAAAAG